MVKETLLKIEGSIPENSKQAFKKRLILDHVAFIELSNNLKSMVENYRDLKETLFKNSEDAIHFSGDILAKTLHDYWLKGEDIEDIFIENAQAASFYGRFKCIW
jgi:hypothetical protein